MGLEEEWVVVVVVRLFGHGSHDGHGGGGGGEVVVGVDGREYGVGGGERGECLVVEVIFLFCFCFLIYC